MGKKLSPIFDFGNYGFASNADNPYEEFYDWIYVLEFIYLLALMAGPL